VLGHREEPGPRVSRKKWRDAFVSARAPDPRRWRDRDVALLLGPAPESAYDGGDLLARSWRALAPEIDDVAQVVDGDVDRLLVGERDAHPSEDGLVVAERGWSRAVLVAEPAQVATDELAKRRRAVGLVLHRLADDAGGFTERQARVMAVRATRALPVDGVLGPRKGRRDWHIAKERELMPRIELDGDIAGALCHARQAAMARSPITRQ
jgi:hypothetical protein